MDGAPLPLSITNIDVTYTDHAVCRYTLRAAWPPGGRERKLTVTDGTFADRPGVLNLTLDRRGGAKLELVDIEEPPIKVRTRPLAQLTAEETALSRKGAASVMLTAPWRPG